MTAKKPTVAILYFDDNDQGGELSMLKKGQAQMLITDLVGHPNVRLVERAQMQEIFDELKLNASKKVDPDTAVKIGKILGAQYVMVGAYFVITSQLVISARLINVSTTDTVSSVRVLGKPDNFFELEGELSSKLFSVFTTQVPPTAGAARDSPPPPKRPGPSNVKVALGYSRAHDAIDKKDKPAAKKELEAVLKQQPDFVLAALDLADLVK